jgi:peptidyl-prolyl cis-trans isomerase A (cyclophilin A)
MKNIAKLALIALLSFNLSATIVEFDTSIGKFQVNLFDQGTPKTVSNFLNYIEQGDYQNVVMHRLSPNFVLQAGAFTFDGSVPLTNIESRGNVDNEPVYSNVRGTIAMAKLSDLPDSASSQWFFNLSDNSGNLDIQNGGFTAFGQVIDQGMDVVDEIAALPRFNFGGTLYEMPLRNYTSEDYSNQIEPNDNNMVLIFSIEVVDPDTNSASGLNPALNTLINDDGDNESTSGGSMGWVSLLALFAIIRRRLGLNNK